MSIVPFGGRTGGLTGPFAVEQWDPFKGFPFNTALASTSSGLFNPFAFDLWDPFDSYPFGTFLTRPSTGVVWKETPEAHFFRASLPGVREEEVQVLVDGQTLQISGGQLLSRFSLPEDAKVDHLRAGMEDGLLIVMVPKVEVRKPNVRTVEISG